MEVLASWAWDVESGKVTEIELQQWKAQLQQADCTVLPTCGDKWVSLNPNTGLVCVCDDEKIQEEFSEELENLHFLQLNSVHHSRITSNKHGGQNLQPFYVALGVPLLSQVCNKCFVGGTYLFLMALSLARNNKYAVCHCSGFPR